MGSRRTLHVALSVDYYHIKLFFRWVWAATNCPPATNESRPRFSNNLESWHVTVCYSTASNARLPLVSCRGADRRVLWRAALYSGTKEDPAAFRKSPGNGFGNAHGTVSDPFFFFTYSRTRGTCYDRDTATNEILPPVENTLAPVSVPKIRKPKPIDDLHLSGLVSLQSTRNILKFIRTIQHLKKRFTLRIGPIGGATTRWMVTKQATYVAHVDFSCLLSPKLDSQISMILGTKIFI